MKDRLPIYMMIFMFSLAMSVVLQAIEVTTISPASHKIDADRGTDIVVDLTVAVDPATVTGTTFMVTGRYSGIAEGTFSFEEGNTRIRFTPNNNFSAGEMVTVNLSKSIADAAGNPVANGYCWQFWAKSGPGSMTVTEIDRIEVRQEGEGHIQTYGANAADLNGDGYSDYLVPNENTNDVRVFLNDGEGSYNNFTIHNLPNAARPSTNEAADLDHDGDMDIAIGNTQNSTVNVLWGDGNGGFTAIESYTAGSGVRGLTLADLDGDGFMDIITTNRNANNISRLMNNGNGSFASAQTTEANGNGETAIAAADANNDGILDIFVGSYVSSEIAILLGDGEGGLTFSDEVTAPGNPWMMAVGDIDGDGDVDCVTANSGNNTVAVVRGDGQGGLEAAESYSSGQNFPLAIDLGDLDGDGDLDMMVSNFGVFGAENGQWRLWENDGQGNFINPQDLSASSAASCSVFHDRDNDGDLDITGIDELHDLLFIFDNSPTAIEDTPEATIEGFTLYQNYPNPFNPSTTIRFAMDRAASVDLEIVDVSGRVIATLLRGDQKTIGEHTVVWDGRDMNDMNVSSGIYIYRLQTNQASSSRKLVLMR